MNRLIYLIILILLFNGCSFLKPKLILEPVRLESNNQIRITEIKDFVDSMLSDSIDLNNFFKTKSIDRKGNICSISFIHGIELYNSILFFDTTNYYPIFETIDSHSILIISGKGLWGKIWAKLLIDNVSKEILKIEFDHQRETPGAGANFTDSDFEREFTNKIISFESDLFSKKSKENNVKVSKYQVDVISGATITCNAAIIMLNSELKRYENYLR